MDRGVEKLSFPFYAPYDDVLIKGVEEDGKWMVYLEASNEIADQEGETVDMEAMNKAKDYYLTHGVLSWDHKHKQKDDPEYIVGEPLDVRFDEGNKTLVKGWLYQHNDTAKKLWNNIRSGAKRLGASIGGGILQKAGSNIKRVIWDEVAITHKPINDATLGSVSMMPFGAFAKALSYTEGNASIEDFIKALTAGSGVDAANFIGGRALTAESLQGATVDILPSRKDLDAMFKAMFPLMIKGDIANYTDMVNHILSKGYSEGVSHEIINYIAGNMSLR